jgi:L-aminopeptidase/D-esterase-like protein
MNAKLVIFTASGPVGAGAGASAGEPMPGIGAVMAGIEDMPAIPGVTLTSVANVSDGAVAPSLLPEQPASSSTAAAMGTVASASFRCW